MPEIPELEVIRQVLTRRLRGRTVAQVIVAPKGGPIVLRDLTGVGFAASLQGAVLDSVSRRGKFLVFAFEGARPLLVVNPKLTGRFQLCAPAAKRVGPVHVTFAFADPKEELRYVDSKTMGQVYLTDRLEAIPTFADMGPDALEITLAEFRERLGTFRGEIKGILTRGSFVAGIGNAYADEILWHARIHPYRKRTSLTQAEVEQLFDSMGSVLRAAIEQVRLPMGDDVHLKPRDFFAVHMRSGEACPRCGTPVSVITANQRITNFCRACQPGGLLRGMGSPP
ncbi:MAG: hypothetical protein MUO35_08260 [Anaerolineales bacterium]|nr:hypothetical protein [Anaerolineales bacterium]